MANGVYININYPKLTIYGLVSKNEPNDIKYVGMTRRNPLYRLSNHIYEAKKEPNKNNRTKWISLINYEIIQIILDEIYDENIIFWEQFWISQIKTWGFELTNSNSGGGGLNKRNNDFSNWLSKRNMGNKYNIGKKHSEDTKLKISLKKIGKSSPRKGCIVSEETKNKQSLAKIGKIGNATGFKHSEETKNKKRKPVYQLDLDGKIIKEWLGAREASKNLAINESKITSVCKGNRITTGGFKWKYVNLCQNL
jgi:hypothetical protein